MVRANRCTLTNCPVTLAFVMVLCSILPGVIRAFMVVPDTNPGMHLMSCLQVRVSLVLSMAHAVVGESDNFTVGIVLARR